MCQLDLFGSPSRVDSPPEKTSAVSVDVGDDPRQLDLFSAALEDRRRGLAALLALDVGVALTKLRSALKLGGHLGPALIDEIELATRASSVLADCRRASGVDSARALRRAIDGFDFRSADPSLAAGLRRSLLIRLGASIEAALGPGGVLDDLPAGRAFLEGYAFDPAARSLELTVCARPSDVASWIDLGNARLALGDTRGARAAFLSGLLADPIGVKVESFADPALHEAALFAAADLDGPGDPREWIATAGLLLRVFPPQCPEQISDHTGSRFFALLCAVERGRARGDICVAPRRELRALEPAVFARYIEWLAERA